MENGCELEKTLRCQLLAVLHTTEFLKQHIPFNPLNIFNEVIS